MTTTANSYVAKATSEALLFVEMNAKRFDPTTNDSYVAALAPKGAYALVLRLQCT